MTEWAGAIERDFGFQAAFMEAAGAAARLPVAARELNELAWARALTGPVRTMGRSFGRERAEELADTVNYGSWDLQMLGGRTDAGAMRAREDLAAHAKALVEAWYWSQQARSHLGR